MDLVTFLKARLDEDAEVAQVAGLVTWPSGTMRPGEEDFLNRFHNQRVLAEVDAKRRIVNDHTLWMGWHGDRPTCSRCYDGDYVHDEASEFPCLTVRALAFPYADHRDYDPAWRPAE